MAEGWEKAIFDDVVRTISVRGHQVQTDEYKKEGRWPIVDQGPNSIVGYTDKADPINGPFPLTLFGDHTRVVKRIGRKFIVGADGVKLLFPEDPRISPEFLFVAVQNLAEQLPRLGYSRHFKELKEMLIYIPSMDEQNKITSILQAWNEAVEALSALRTAKKKRLDGLISRIVNGQEYVRRRLRNFMREVSERNSSGAVERVLSVTNSAGFVLAENQFAHRVASADTSNYKIVRKGQYAYNPARINVGSIARLDDWDNGLLSPMYAVFELKAGLDSDFFSHWLSSYEARQRIRRAAQGSVRETVGLDDLGAIMIPCPPPEKQAATARMLNAAQEDLRLTGQNLNALQRQKRGLMQKLLTGEWRVAV